MDRSHIHPAAFAGVNPPTTVTLIPLEERRQSRCFSAAALIHRWRVRSKKGWLRVVWITELPRKVRTVRLKRLVSWWTRTAATISGCVLPVLTLVARTLSPGLSWLIGTVLPPASSTLVDAVKLRPQDAAASSARLPPSSAATLRPSSARSPPPSSSASRPRLAPSVAKAEAVRARLPNAVGHPLRVGVRAQVMASVMPMAWPATRAAAAEISRQAARQHYQRHLRDHAAGHYQDHAALPAT